jgi:hypothetical protein
MATPSTPRCRVGDRCFVIAPTIPDNTGRIVRILRPAPCSRPGDVWWTVASEGSPMPGELRSGEVVHTMELTGPDAALLPIRPEPPVRRKAAERKRVARA